MQGFGHLLYTLLYTNQSSLGFLSRQIQSGDVTSCMQTAIHCQYLSSFAIHADYFFNGPIHDTRIA